MRIEEVTSTLPRFIAVIRVDGTIARTVIEADGLSQAKTICSHVYGASNVQSVSQMPLTLREIDNSKPKASYAKPQSPSELRVKAMSDQAETLKKQAKRIKAQHGVQKAQERLRNAMHP